MWRSLYIKRSILTITYFFLEGLILFGRNNPPKSNDKKRVLVVRTDNIGDFILWKNFADALFDKLKGDGYEITLVVNAVFAELAKDVLPNVRVLPVTKVKFIKNPFYRFRILREIASCSYDLAINPAFSRDLLLSDPLIRASKAPLRVGHMGDSSNFYGVDKLFSDYIYSNLIRIPDNIVHEIDKNQAFISQIGAGVVSNVRPELGSLDVDIRKLCLPENYVVISVGTSWIGRQWPIERFQWLAEWIYTVYHYPIVLVGDHNDRHKSNQIIQSIEGVNLCGESLVDLPRILAKSKMVICNETSIIHFAFSVGVDAICILGGGHFGRFLPYPDHVRDKKSIPIALHNSMDCFGCNWQCRYPRASDQPVRCVDNVSLEMVQREIANILKKKTILSEQ